MSTKCVYMYILYANKVDGFYIIVVFENQSIVCNNFILCAYIFFVHYLAVKTTRCLIYIFLIDLQPKLFNTLF